MQMLHSQSQAARIALHFFSAGVGCSPSGRQISGDELQLLYSSRLLSLEHHNASVLVNCLDAHAWPKCML
jgi:hypothetical protein